MSSIKKIPSTVEFTRFWYRLHNIVEQVWMPLSTDIDDLIYRIRSEHDLTRYIELHHDGGRVSLERLAMSANTCIEDPFVVVMTYFEPEPFPTDEVNRAIEACRITLSAMDDELRFRYTKKSDSWIHIRDDPNAWDFLTEPESSYTLDDYDNIGPVARLRRGQRCYSTRLEHILTTNQWTLLEHLVGIIGKAETQSYCITFGMQHFLKECLEKSVLVHEFV